MKLYPIDGRWVGHNKEFMEAVSAVLSNLKIYFGAINNSLYLHLGQALMSLNDLNLKSDKRLVKKVWQEWKQYENTLKYSDLKYFDLDTLPADARAKIGEHATNEDYFDYWLASGGEPYRLSLPLVNCLTNKYKLLLESNGVKSPENKAPLMSILSLLANQLESHEESVKLGAKHLGIRVQDMKGAIAPFRLQRVHDAWWHLMRHVIPELKDITPTELEQKNIDMTLEQLFRLMNTEDFLFSGVSKATEDYDDFFRTKGNMKKTLQEIAEVREYFKNFK